MTDARTLIVEADGGSRGNPGVAGYGALIRDGRTGQLLAERAEPLGQASNNVAEYSGLIAGLQAVLDLGCLGAAGTSVRIRMDSKLVVEQMSGRWKIKHQDMRRLALQARDLVRQIQAAGGQVSFEWIPRVDNSAADALSNDAMDGMQIRRDYYHADDAASPSTAAGGDPEADEARALSVSAPARSGQARLIFVRHGVTEFTERHVVDGRGGPDPGLSATGGTQALAAAAAVSDFIGELDADAGAARVVTSSLARAKETGQAIADRLGVTAAADPDWDEQGFGAWDGLAMVELAENQPEELHRLRTDSLFRPPGGESREQVDQRVAAALDRIIQPDQVAVVVTHRGALISVLSRLLGMPTERAWSIALDPASLTAVEVWPDGGIWVRFVNDTHHLRTRASD